MSDSSHIAIDTAYPGNLFMVVAPSGAGKSTLVNALLAQDPAIRLSISHTTRQPRPGEQNGREYHFTTVDDFRTARDRGDFLEWAEVHGNYYATSRVDRATDGAGQRRAAGDRLAGRAAGA
jgi:guanylate kinase